MKSRVRTTLSLILFICIFCGLSYAIDDSPRLRASADRKAIFIGDRIRYAIEASYGEAQEVLMPSFKDEKIGDFEIKDFGQIDRSGFFGKHSISNWYSITAYSPGRHAIPQVEVKYRNKNAKDYAILKTPAININVQSVMPKNNPSADIKDVKGPYGFFEINWRLVLGITFFLAVLVFFIIKKTRRLPPERLPHETALEELEGARSDFLKGGGVKEFYVGGADCIRRYIERAFTLKAPEMTTEEFLNSLKDAEALVMEQKTLLREFLNACDLVKFAKYAPTRMEIELLYDTAKRFIEETKQLFLMV
ncbi:MAG: hypothetical protein Q8Q87_00670 [Candidatus Omnitrophota bacterium]|nr:hypothetical protein [Candidatus Omnitrophota bacterium]